MCYGMNCRYEMGYTGECKLGGRNIPEDAACRDTDEMVCPDCDAEFERSEIEDDTCPNCGSDQIQEDR